MSELKPFKLTRPQITSAILNAKREVDISGRASTKTSKKAMRMIQIAHQMPRSTNALAGRTYKQLFTNTLMPIKSALERLGYYQDKHYFVRKKPPANWKWPKPYENPDDYDNFIIWYTGAGWHIFSQDREGNSRGQNIDSFDADEGLLLDRNRLQDEVMKANRGNESRFRHLHLHHSWTISSSMPVSAKGSWLLDYGNYYEEDGHNFWQIWNRVLRLQLAFLKEKNVVRQKEIMREWLPLLKQIQFYNHVHPRTKETLAFLFFNVFDNIENVGLNYIYDQLEGSTSLSFRVEMMNERIVNVADCFYKIDEEKHLYDSFDRNYIDRHIEKSWDMTDADSRQDADVDSGRSLDVMIDYGSAINAMRVCQEHFTDLKGNKKWQYRFLNSLFVKYPSGLKDLVNKFCDYYEYHRCKEVSLFYDHTAIGTDAVRLPYINEAIKYFEARGWKVRPIYIGKAPPHNSKYLLWEILLRGDDNRFPEIQFNRINDKEGILSMQLAAVKQGRNGWEKDKSSEKSALIPREQATDLSDAGDLAVWYRFSSKLNKRMEFISPGSF